MKQIKSTLLFTILLSLNVAASTPKTILECLGREELIIHKNAINGPIYDLNQRFINELAAGNSIKVKSKFLKKICSHNEFTPSINLLRALLLNGKDIFITNSSNKVKSPYQSVAIDDITKKVPQVFFHYISKFQLLTSDANCLNETIPEIKFFQDKFKYLEGSISQEQLLKDKSKIEKIFSSLKNFDSIIKKCQERILSMKTSTEKNSM